ncbi:hypothetical protein AAE478_010256 [Parahypoxylon ruwenzoriense]
MNSSSGNRETPSERLMELLKKCGSFEDLPDVSDSVLCGTQKHKIFLNQTGSCVSLSKKDAAMKRYEDYLRLKWPCSEAMPPEFDPDKLEAIRKARFPFRTADENFLERKDTLHELATIGKYQKYEDTSGDMYLGEANTSSESLTSDVSVTESLDNEEHLENYESEVVVHVASMENIIPATPERTTIRRSTACTLERKPTPRIRSGSKPPLCRSAFAGAGQAVAKDGCDGQSPGTKLKGYPQAPRYFPFRSRIGRD